MKVICAPDKFKGCLSAATAAQAMARGIRRALPEAEIDVCPVADGGEGTVEAIIAATGGELRHDEVTGPLGQKVQAAWGMSPDGPTAVIEMAAAAGLELVPPDRRDPTRTTTFGVGELIACAIDAGATRIILGIGGSATCDGGCGVAAALGAQFFTDDSQGLQSVDCTGGDLHRITIIRDNDVVRQRVAGCDIRVACDVTNPLTGLEGAAYVYAPQKGATAEQVELLDRGLRHLASLWREQLGIDVEALPGAGAAGGLGGGLVAFLHASLVPGIALVLDAVNFEQRVADCGLCLTGEGRIDGQTASGKACIGVAQAAQRHGVPTIALVGGIGPDANRTLQAGLREYHVIGEGLSLEESMRRAEELIEATAQRVVAGF
ncbi:MAG: glycerate kinase [Phycisphaeraceae bacterium]